MSLQKSPGGAYFPYFYKGGELFGLHLGGYASDEDGVIAMMKAEENFILKQYRKMGLWIDFYETKLTPRVIGEFVEMLERIQPRVTKLGIVGCSWISKWKINRQMKKTGYLLTFPVEYYSDPEEAKTWLVSQQFSMLKRVIVPSSHREKQM